MKEKLADIRQKLDQIDDRIMELLLERLKTVEQVGELKRIMGIVSHQPDEEERRVKRFMEFASRHSLDPDFLKEVYQLLHREALKRQ